MLASAKQNGYKSIVLLVVLLTAWMPSTAFAAGGNATEIMAQSTNAIDWQLVGEWLINFLLETITFLVFGALALWLIPRPFSRAVQRVQSNPFKSFGLGIVVIIVGYLAAGLLFLLIIAMWLGFLGIRLSGIAGFVFGIGLSSWAISVALFSVFVAFISKLVVAFLMGKLILKKFPAENLGRQLIVLLPGVVIYLLLRSIPWVGLVVGGIATLLGLGAFWMALREHKISIQAVHPADEAPAKDTLQPAEEEEPVSYVAEASEQNPADSPQEMPESEVSQAD